MNRAIFPGSFDPFTVGHANLVARALRLFDEVIIAVGYNEHKSGWLPVEERVRALREYYANTPAVRIESYSCLTVDFALSRGANAILRGVRSIKDYEYEAGIADINAKLSATTDYADTPTNIETVILLSDPTMSAISSSVLRELHHFGRDITPWLPEGLIYKVQGKK